MFHPITINLRGSVKTGDSYSGGRCFESRVSTVICVSSRLGKGLPKIPEKDKIMEVSPKVDFKIVVTQSAICNPLNKGIAQFPRSHPFILLYPKGGRRKKKKKIGTIINL